jgi:diguanylate cyclase (GGDEF)-like protein/PAS domain S-box-containing protein
MDDKYNNKTREDLIEELKSLRGKLQVCGDAEEELGLTQFSVDKTSDAVFWVGPDARILYVNNGASKVLGYSKEEFTSMHVYDIDPNFPKNMWRAHWDDLKARGSLTFISAHRAKDGTEMPVEITANFISFGGKEYNFAFARDISDRLDAEKKIKESEMKFKAIFDNSTDGIIVMDPRERKFCIFNKTICGMLGYGQDEVMALQPNDIHTEEDWPYVQEKFIKGMQKHISFAGDIPMKKKNGDIFYADISAYPIILQDKEYLVCLFRDITEQKKSAQKLEVLNKYLIKTNEKLKYIAMRDFDTGLYNYHYLVDAVESEFARAKRYHAAFSMIMLDIDYFRSINEVYGTKFGDKIIKQLSARLTKLVRQYDNVVRYSGEEFAVLCPSTDEKEAVKLARRVSTDIRLENFGGHDHTVRLKVSIGVASFPHTKAVKGMDIVDAAQKATEEAKDLGGSRVCCYGDTGKVEIKEGNRTRSNVRGLKRKLDKLTKKTHQNLVEAIFAFARTIEMKDHYTGEHGEKTVFYATEIARRLKMPQDEIERIRQAAVLHDLGKVGISDNVLLKKGKLNKKEIEEIKKHPQIAADILRPIQVLREIIPYIFYHHEHWDGSGYPIGLKGAEIPIGARIIAISDVYQALCSDRPYRKALSKAKAISVLKKGSGTHFDPKVVNTLMDIIKKEKG